MPEKGDIFNPRNVMEQRGPLVEEVPDFGIQPKDIDTSKHFYDAFGNNETEISAKWIVRMCQQKNSWEPFTREEIEDFYRKNGLEDGFEFNQLVKPKMAFFIQEGRVPVGGGWIVEKDGEYHVTTAFIEAVHKSSPAVPASS